MTLLKQIETPWQTGQSLGPIPDSFKCIQKHFLLPLGRTVTDIKRERESAEYGAIRFTMAGLTCLFRQSKHTPKKIGQFVTLWKRPTPDSEIAPFDRDDGIDRVIIFADEQSRFGVFVFKPQLLIKKDIFSEQSEGGKRAFRLYAPWIVPVAAQAKRSKIWQCAHFIELTNFESGRTQLDQVL